MERFSGIKPSGAVANYTLKPFGLRSEERYEISPNDAVMAFQGEKRGFTDVDATRLLNLLHVLTGYCIQSTVWWYEG